MIQVHELNLISNNKLLEEIIVDTVTSQQGIKFTQLVCDVLFELHKKQYAKYEIPTADKIFSIIEKLVRERKLVRISYVLAHKQYREKEILFPAGTTIDVKEQDMVVE